MRFQTYSLVFSALAALVIAAPPQARADEQTIIQSVDANDPNVDGVFFPGAGILTRSKSRVDVSLHLTELHPLGAYTSWWIVFNEPDDCTDPCDLDDLASGVGQGFYATGYIAGADGTANVYAGLAKGPVAEGADRLSQFFPFDPDSEVGLNRPLSAEIHLLAARFHGEVQTGWAAHQIGTFDGACGPDLSACSDVQAVIFRAPN